MKDFAFHFYSSHNNLSLDCILALRKILGLLYSLKSLLGCLRKTLHNKNQFSNQYLFRRELSPKSTGQLGPDIKGLVNLISRFLRLKSKYVFKTICINHISDGLLLVLIIHCQNSCDRLPHNFAVADKSGLTIKPKSYDHSLTSLRVLKRHLQ